MRQSDDGWAEQDDEASGDVELEPVPPSAARHGGQIFNRRSGCPAYLKVGRTGLEIL
jgi:hypothetical protein